MKYAVILCDGMADYPVPELDGKTPMEVADKPNMDYFAAHGEVGLVKTVADGLKPGSDVANLSVMGYDPAIYYSGRSPLEAASMGIDLAPTDVAMRCNLVTLSDDKDYSAKTMVDYCADDISTAEAAELIKAVQDAFGDDEFTFYSGISYRHCLVWHGGTTDIGTLTPPHDISGRVIGDYLNKEPMAAKLIEMMIKSVDILKDHPVNKTRIAAGRKPATSIWLWGQGKKPQLDSFTSKFGLKGSVVSAVDLIKGIGVCADMKVCEVEGATGYIDTCFNKKAQAAFEELEAGQDFVYIHFEAPDECGHRHEVDNKVKAIEIIDKEVLSYLREKMDKFDNYKIMILPDHPTPLVTKTHASDPVPYIIYEKVADKYNGIDTVNENTAKETGIYIAEGHTLMNRFLGK